MTNRTPKRITHLNINPEHSKEDIFGDSPFFHSEVNYGMIPPPSSDHLLQEDGFALLQENGDYILIT